MSTHALMLALALASVHPEVPKDARPAFQLSEPLRLSTSLEEWLASLGLLDKKLAEHARSEKARKTPDRQSSSSGSSQLIKRMMR